MGHTSQCETVLLGVVLCLMLMLHETAACAPSAAEGYGCMRSLSLGRLHWKYDAETGMVDLALESNSSGWVAMGIGSAMMNSDIILGDTAGVRRMRIHGIYPVIKTDHSPREWTHIHQASTSRQNGKRWVSFSVETSSTTSPEAFPLIFASRPDYEWAYHTVRETATVDVTSPPRQGVEATAVPSTAIPDISDFDYSLSHIQLLKMVGIFGILVFLSWVSRNSQAAAVTQKPL
eukprot:TRINITY_DN9940_c1_g3_i1.p2 TRINITY_DN9940_c1_g3~~TRINITY_DN9940_c1_g3_i1.p2  ORF type:complete len:233 (+),score=42.37 TRINITY_DN9940_c1_g3_i1:99-797(+)